MAPPSLATLRALGMTRGGARSILAMQGTAVALVGLTVGIPLGVAVGRNGWRLITSRVPLSFAGPIALVAILRTLVAIWRDDGILAQECAGSSSNLTNGADGSGP